MSRWYHYIPRPPLTVTAIRTLKLLAGYHFFAAFIAEPRLCNGFSMLPTLSYEGDWVLVSPLPYRRPFAPTRTPDRGDLVFATSPSDPTYPVCKRVVGLPGDVIEVDPRRDGNGNGNERRWEKEESVYDEEVVTRDGVVRNNERPIVSGGSKRKEGQFVRVPKGHVWITGDNMSNSTDSRMYGPVPIAIIKGKVLARLYPNPTWFKNDVRSVS